MSSIDPFEFADHVSHYLWDQMIHTGRDDIKLLAECVSHRTKLLGLG